MPARVDEAEKPVEELHVSICGSLARTNAEVVDEKMSKLADQRAATDNYRIAVLAALELADELLDLRAVAEGRAEGEKDRLAALLARVDDTIAAD